MKWLLDNIPWVFSGAGVAIILGVVSLLRARGWFRNPLKHLEVRPIPDFSQIPNLADGPARFHFALRVTNTHSMPVFISAMQAQLRVPPDGHRAIAPTYITTTTAAGVSFPARLD